MNNDVYKHEPLDKILEYINFELLKIIPAEKIKEHVSNIDDVYEKRAVLKECRWNFESFDHLLSVFVETISEGLHSGKK